ncbi:MAG: ribose-phosphate diphosphokinase [Gammaproteobacteria bacterium]
MMIILAWPTDAVLARHTAELLSAPVGIWSLHTFPDTELKVTIESNVENEDVWVIASLDHVNEKVMALMLIADTCRSLGARSVKLVSPYLAYMRQDIRFHPGESISAHVFAGLISRYFDALITVDPHCHRIARLSDIYTIPCVTLHAQPLFKQYIVKNIASPLIIGPDAESEQWTADLANSMKAPYVVLEKKRLGDADVEIDLPDLRGHHDRTPIFIDDIISTGKTVMVAMDALTLQGFLNPYVLAVHGLFVDDAYEQLLERTPNIITTNSIMHPSSQIDLAPLLAEAMR